MEIINLVYVIVIMSGNIPMLIRSSSSFSKFLVRLLMFVKQMNYFCFRFSLQVFLM